MRNHDQALKKGVYVDRYFQFVSLHIFMKFPAVTKREMGLNNDH
jgi:hypothetical protein